VILERHHVEDETPRPVRLDLAPMLATCIVHRGLDDPVILGAVGIGENDQPVAVVFDGVVVLRLARADEAWRTRQVVGVDQADLGGLVIVDAEQKEPAALRGAEPEKKAGVGLLVEDGIDSIGFPA
jgi:hypothetical protein